MLSLSPGHLLGAHLAQCYSFSRATPAQEASLKPPPASDARVPSIPCSGGVPSSPTMLGNLRAEPCLSHQQSLGPGRGVRGPEADDDKFEVWD